MTNSNKSLKAIIMLSGLFISLLGATSITAKSLLTPKGTQTFEHDGAPQ